MNANTSQPGSHTIKKGNVVFLEGNKVHSLNILLQGKIDVYISCDSKKKSGDTFSKSYKLFSIDKSTFIGTNDLITESRYNCSYHAAEDCAIYSYPLQSLSQTWSLINSQKDYGSFIISSLFSMISSSCDALEKLQQTVSRLRTLTENLITFFWVLKEYNSFAFTPSQSFLREGLDKLDTLRNNGIQLVPYFNKQFIEQNTSELDEDNSIQEPSSVKSKIEYYEHLNNLPIDLRKSFFGTDMFLTSFHCRDEAECYEEILTQLRDTFADAERYFIRLYSEEHESIYTSYLKAASEMAASGQDNTALKQTLEYIVNLITEIVTLYKSEYCHKCETDLDYIEHSYNNIMAAIHNQSAASESSTSKTSNDYTNIPDELKDSTVKILEYSGLPKEQTDSFVLNLLAFRNMKDRLSTDEGARNIRNNIASSFFEIYEAVSKKAFDSKDSSRLINMFLNFAYMDEKLLTPEQTLSLYKLAGKDATSFKDSIFSMREWLSKIYAAEKDPSINEFGQDYFDVFREMKKLGKVTDKDKNAYDTNVQARLEYEVRNMLKTNQKLCHGQISVYFPVLHQEMITKDLEKSLLTTTRVRESLEKILEVDYSAFHREIHFIDPHKIIEKELIMKCFEPDIIFIPIYGTRAMMWQEITGRNRNTPGRFLLPAFLDDDLDSVMLKLVGNFRWELCRTMMGAAWNDITQKSLTSEYTDYIQFYKKNKDLSEEVKDKIKSQIVKYHNRTRDIFTADYELWVNNESKGNIRLNKVARNILFKYCPFPKTIRDQLEKQPMYIDTIQQFKNLRIKTAKDLEYRYAKYLKTNGSLDPAMEYNLKYYRDL